MRIGIISDTHDDQITLEKALEVLRGKEVTQILHCGDVCGPGMIGALEGFDVWIAQGNMDRQPSLAVTVNATLGRSRLAWFHRLTLDGYSVAMLHGDNEEVLRTTIACGKYAYALHGHTHLRRNQKVGRTRVINPGALGGSRSNEHTFCTLDLATGETSFLEV